MQAFSLIVRFEVTWVYYLRENFLKLFAFRIFLTRLSQLEKIEEEHLVTDIREEAHVKLCRNLISQDFIAPS